MLDYQLALTNVKFDNTYTNVLRFNTRAEQEAYFNINTLFSNAPNVNFNVGSLYATNVIYDAQESDSINELLCKNYLIVKDNSANKTLNYYYYFVTNAIQESGKRISLSLELDVMQTYYIDLTFSDCNIMRAHLNRFIEVDNNSVKFDGTPTSKLFARESLPKCAKRLIKRTKISANYINGETTFEQWLDENVLCWVYLYLSPQDTYSINHLDQTQYSQAQIEETRIENIDSIKTDENYSVPTNMSVCCFPIYKSDNNELGKDRRIMITNQDDTGDRVYLCAEALNNFLERNGGFSKIYSFKIDYMSPFGGLIPNYEIDENELDYTYLIIKLDTSDNNYYYNAYYRAFLTSSSNFYGLLNIVRERASIGLAPYEVSKPQRFLKSEIIGANKDAKFNPKLLSQDFFEINVTNQSTNGFIYDYQKVNQEIMNLILSDPLTPDTTKQYIRLIPEENNIYIEETAYNLTGLVSDDDLTLTMATSNYQSVLANQKNFYEQAKYNINARAELREYDAYASIGSSLFTLNPFTILGQTYQSGVALNRSAKQKEIDNKNLEFTIDNMKSAPGMVDKAKGNANFYAMTTSFGAFVEEYDILDNEREQINDYMCLFGFSYNQIDNVKNVDNIRKYYNFVRADIEQITNTNLSISNTVRDKIKTCFLNGMRFWNVDTFSYDLENYERWLEDEE